MSRNQFEMTDVEYLRDLAERLRHIPVCYGTDGADIDRIGEIINHLPKPPKPKKDG